MSQKERNILMNIWLKTPSSILSLQFISCAPLLFFLHAVDLTLSNCIMNKDGATFYWISLSCVMVVWSLDLEWSSYSFVKYTAQSIFFILLIILRICSEESLIFKKRIIKKMMKLKGKIKLPVKYSSFHAVEFKIKALMGVAYLS